jgi:cytochrome c peroxidase
MLSLFALSVGCAPERPGEHATPPRIPQGLLATAEAPFEPIPHDLGLEPARVALGGRLFAERAVSGDGTRACVDCHDLAQGGVVPNEERSNHPDNATGPYNVPTVFNVAFNFRYNWNGKFETLEDHLGGPMMSEVVMDAGSWADVVTRLQPLYADAFEDAGYGALDEISLRDAMATYQRSLITPDCDFDRYLRGEIPQTEAQQAGYRLFREVGCSSCHQGINLGGNMFQRFGVMEDAFGGRPLTNEDYGRMQVTGDEADAFVFRVPSLRNVALTAPYFHDGSAATLPEAIRHMATVQLGVPLSEVEIQQIQAFLESLTGTYRPAP